MLWRPLAYAQGGVLLLLPPGLPCLLGHSLSRWLWSFGWVVGKCPQGYSLQPLSPSSSALLGRDALWAQGVLPTWFLHVWPSDWSDHSSQGGRPVGTRGNLSGPDYNTLPLTSLGRWSALDEQGALQELKGDQRVGHPGSESLPQPRSAVYQVSFSPPCLFSNPNPQVALSAPHTAVRLGHGAASWHQLAGRQARPSLVLGAAGCCS